MDHGQGAAGAAIVGAALALLGAGAASAQGFAGAELSADILAFTEDLDFGAVRYRGAVEVDVGAGFGIAADVSYQGWRALGTDGRNLTLRALYDGLGFATVGAFYGRDSLEGGTADSYGIEAAGVFGGFEAEGALGMLEGEGGDGGALLLAQGRYGFGGFGGFGGLAATGRVGRLSGDLDATRLGLGAEYDLGFGPVAYGEVGRLSSDGEGETYVMLGARVAIGPKAGTTFSSRGLFEVIPGF